MVDTTVENAYIKHRMQTLPNEKSNAQVHVIKKGESLWGLAQEALGGKGNASNAEISDYVLRIAKLNNFDTVEKMNSIKADSRIYMPGTVSKTKPSVKLEKSKTSAEISAKDVIDTVLKDKTLSITNQIIGGKKSNYYTVYNNYSKNGYISTKHPVIAFQMSTDGKLVSASFEDSNENINYYSFDYNMDKTGRIYKRKYSMNGQQVGKISNQEYQQLESKLAELTKMATPSY